MTSYRLIYRGITWFRENVLKTIDSGLLFYCIILIVYQKVNYYHFQMIYSSSTCMVSSYISDQPSSFQFRSFYPLFSLRDCFCILVVLSLTCYSPVQFSSVQLLSRVRLFATPWTAARQASLSITNSWSLPKPMSIESVMPSNYLILCHPLLLPPSIFPSIRVFSNESALHIRWPKYWSFSFNISASSEHPGLISFRMDWLDLLAVQGTLKSRMWLSDWTTTNSIF